AFFRASSSSLHVLPATIHFEFPINCSINGMGSNFSAISITRSNLVSPLTIQFSMLIVFSNCFESSFCTDTQVKQESIFLCKLPYHLKNDCCFRNTAEIKRQLIFLFLISFK